MNDDKMAIIILCSRLCINKNIKPYSAVQFSKLKIKLENLNLKVSDLIFFSKEDLSKHFEEEEVNRIENLKKRSESIAFEIQKFNDLMIEIITLEDENYPKQIKKKLSTNSPPIFYVVGDLNICNKKSIGFVGSRNIEYENIDVTRKLVEKANEKGYVIVSGGAKGVDSTATAFADYSIEYVADSLIKKLKDKNRLKAINEKRLVMLSDHVPNGEFHKGIATGRNKLIYAQSEATVVIKSDYETGGTWSGAMEAIKKGYCRVFCIFNEEKGNTELVKKGAIAIGENWDISFDNSPIRPEQLRFNI